MNRIVKIAAIIAQGGNNVYQTRVKALFGANLIGYWPLDETAGAVANDLSGNGRHGLYSGVTLANVPAPNGRSAPLFDGTTSFVNIFSNSLRDAFPGAAGSIHFYSRVANAAVYTDTVDRHPVFFTTNTADKVDYSKSSAANYIQAMYRGGGVLKAVSHAETRTQWMLCAIEWSKADDALISYTNSFADAAPVAALGVWSGTLAAAIIGAVSAVPTNVYSGWISDVIMLDRRTTEADRLALYGLSRMKIITYLGDSITISTGGYAFQVADQHNSGRCTYKNKAVGNHSIMVNMDAQAASAATDNADIIIIALGTNDTDTTDALRAKYESNLNTLKTSNPRARIYGMGILNRTVETGRDAKNALIATACANAGAVYWNTNGWIDPATDTSDGVHPTAGGHAKITVQVLARLP